MDAAQFIRDAVVERLARKAGGAAGLPRKESELLREINEGPPPDTWERFHALVARRQSETLTGDERSELIALTDEIEARNVRRIERLAELANLRGTSLPSVMDELGIHPPPYR